MAKGRPTNYTPEIAAKICEMLAAGISLRAICQEPQMPHESTVRKWAREDVQGFYTQYAHARDIGLDCLADRILEVAETPLVAEKRVQKADGSVEITTADAVDRSRLTVDSLKWYLCKLAPKKYGDKIDATLQGPDGGPIQTEHMIVEYVRQKDKKDPD